MIGVCVPFSFIGSKRRGKIEGVELVYPDLVYPDLALCETYESVSGHRVDSWHRELVPNANPKLGRYHFPQNMYCGIVLI